MKNNLNIWNFYYNQIWKVNKYKIYSAQLLIYMKNKLKLLLFFITLTLSELRQKYDLVHTGAYRTQGWSVWAPFLQVARGQQVQRVYDKDPPYHLDDL